MNVRPRILLGGGLLALSLVPWAIVPFVPLLASSTERLAVGIGGLVIVAEATGAVALLILGREAYEAIKSGDWLPRAWRISNSRPRCTRERPDGTNRHE